MDPGTEKLENDFQEYASIIESGLRANVSTALQSTTGQSTSSGLPLPSAPTIQAPAVTGSTNPYKLITDPVATRPTLRVSKLPQRSTGESKQSETTSGVATIDCYELAVTADRKQFEKFYAKFAALQWVTDPERYDLLGGDKFRLDREKFNAIEQSTGVATDGKLLWVTINPDFPGTVTEGHVDIMYERLERLLAFTWVKDFTLCFEQRALAPAPMSGLHVHLLIDRGKEVPSHCERDIKRVFLGICGNDKHINIMKINPTLKLQKIRYMEGHKQPPEPEKAENDKLMRDFFNLEDIYNKDTFSRPNTEAQEQKSDEEEEKAPNNSEEEDNDGDLEEL